MDGALGEPDTSWYQPRTLIVGASHVGQPCSTPRCRRVAMRSGVGCGRPAPCHRWRLAPKEHRQLVLRQGRQPPPPLPGWPASGSSHLLVGAMLTRFWAVKGTACVPPHARKPRKSARMKAQVAPLPRFHRGDRYLRRTWPFPRTAAPGFVPCDERGRFLAPQRRGSCPATNVAVSSHRSAGVRALRRTWPFPRTAAPGFVPCDEVGVSALVEPGQASPRHGQQHPAG